jgi:signal transduction histidine kinase
VVANRGARLTLGAEVALAGACGLAFFALLAIPLAIADSRLLPVVFLGVAGIAALIAMFRLWGVAYAVPAAIAGLLAFDWFYIPPLHPHAFPDTESFADLLVYLAVGVLIGELAARAGRRAETSELARSELADEQAALRRVATLVAEAAPPPEVFAAVAEEIGQLLPADFAIMGRYEDDHTVTAIAAWGAPVARFPIGSRWSLEGKNLVTIVLETCSPARVDGYEHSSGPLGVAGRESGFRSTVGAPIVVEGAVWGVMAVGSTRQEPPLPAGTETRLAQFTELVATAIANAESRASLARLAEEQAALRRVATLVAEGVPPVEMFAAVAQEVGQLLGVDSTHMGRFEADETAVEVGSWSADGTYRSLGYRVPLDDASVSGLVFKSGRPARVDDYEGASGEITAVTQEIGIRSSVGAPIVVEGRSWGVMVASSNRSEPLPADTEMRIDAFTELVATAISNAEARTETHRLAEEQAALRRVATLVAESAPPGQLFESVAAEVGQLLGVDLASLIRYEGDDKVTPVSMWAADGGHREIGGSWPLPEEGSGERIANTIRVDNWEEVPGAIASFARDELGVVSSVGSPIIVEGRLWGALIVHSTDAEPLPGDTEARVEEFTELVATAISNMQARSELAASRSRIVAATDDERRRVVRDLHDGAQQRLVHTVVTLKMAGRALDKGPDEASPLVTEALEHAEQATEELRELAHGILPSVLTRGGLRAGVGALASRMPLPVETGVSVDRLPPALEATAYFIVAEALTNVAKHARAKRAVVTAQTGNGMLHLQVRDDGIGGAQADGSGLVGIADRVAALDGTLRLESPGGGGTLLSADIPVR